MKRKLKMLIKKWSKYILISVVAVVAIRFIVSKTCSKTSLLSRESYYGRSAMYENRHGMSDYFGSEDQYDIDRAKYMPQTLDAIEELRSFKVVNTVNYFWCAGKHFTFRNYLSVLSVWKFLKPDVIVFYQTVPPIDDHYHDWFQQLQRTIPCLEVKVIPTYWLRNGKTCVNMALGYIFEHGGIFLSEDTIINNDANEFRKERYAVMLYKSESVTYPRTALAMTRSRDSDFQKLLPYVDKPGWLASASHYCHVVKDVNSTQITKAPCYHITQDFHPKDILTLETPFASFVRLLVYGSETARPPMPYIPGFIPNIVHYIWFGTKEVTFDMYLSLLSTLFIANPDRLLIHTDGKLHGKYWLRISKDSRVVIVIRDSPSQIYGHDLVYIQHTSDIVRAEVLLKYGGIYVDWDVFWVNSPAVLRHTGYDAIVNFDHQPHMFSPEMINLGVVMAKANSIYLQKWQDALINYKSDHYLYNAILLPYKIYEKYPDHLYIEKRLQVMCFKQKCHPTFLPGYHTSYKEDKESPFDWRRDVYTIHITDDIPEEMSKPELCEHGEGRFAELCRLILAHEIRLFQNV